MDQVLARPLAVAYSFPLIFLNSLHSSNNKGCSSRLSS